MSSSATTPAGGPDWRVALVSPPLRRETVEIESPRADPESPFASSVESFWSGPLTRVPAAQDTPL